MEDFKNKVAIVTGGNSGIGRSAAHIFARRGARVAIVARRKPEVDVVVEEIKAFGGDAFGISADIANPEQITSMVEQAVERYGRLDIAFNNAGVIGKWAAIDDLSTDDFDQAIGINLRGTWHCIRAEIAQMKRQGGGGAIVNTSSWLAQGALKGSALYSMTKAGLDVLVKSLTFELSEHGIRINNVAPGVIDTPMTSSSTDPDTLDALIAQTPMKRLGTSDEVAEAAVWLSSPASGFVTGQSLLVDGGYTIPGNRM
ncbi:SDR family oxidoreductase [Rhizobium sp. S152]|uniref:SDR family NAD(P)-dependent oxidoreductase n=1 Tax=Rhizobium sp. S152 TaxID=3055038 RepID=UPI0025A9CA63|nr:SDR family oxidoreductase [Rhizobium sp. S152]MDM9628986.1 SDR family oxidoreductase [Rhizobium sp. S152]